MWTLCGAHRLTAQVLVRASAWPHPDRLGARGEECMDESLLLLQREPPVATVVFNRPEARDA
jgi:hypothetical protein